MALRRLPILALLGLVLALVVGCRQQTILTQLDDARSLAADLRVQLNKAADASNRAVMADTDEASIAFARESEQATQVMGEDMTKLAALLQSPGFSKELAVFEDFKRDFAEYHEVDRRVLALAVENTNLKAQSLSFGPAVQAADRFRDALAPVTSSLPSRDQCRAETLALQAVAAVRELQVLYAPHIAEHEDAAMSRIEKAMADHDASARDALKSLEELAPPSTRASLAAARAALDELKGITAKIVELSRRNTNVVSLELSLRKKPALAARCDERLSALQRALASEGSKATR